MLGYGPKCCDRPDGIRGYGNLGAEVMLLGIAPGRKEHEIGRPFVGPSGKLADATLFACGYRREECLATNLICWWKDDPTRDEIEVCSPRLEAEIRQVHPRLIVALGALATERLVGRPIGKARGAIVRPSQIKPEAWGYRLAQELGFCVLPTWHPAAILRVPSMGGDLVRDFLKIPRFLNGELDPPKIQVHFVDDPRYAQVVWDNFETWPPCRVAVDVETANDSEDTFQEVISLAAARRLNGVLHSWVFTRAALDGIFEWHADSIGWMFHNGQFDTQAIYRTFGVWLPIKEDTMLMSYNADERPGYEEQKDNRRGNAHGPGYHSLKTLSREYESCGWYEEEVKGTLGKSLEEMAEPQLIPGEEDAPETTSSTVGAEGISRTPEEAGDESLADAPASTRKKRKPEPKMRLETPAEAQARYEAWLQNLYHYNALDAAYTLVLADRLPTDRDEKNYYEVLLPGANAYKQIQYQGIAVDQRRLAELVAEFAPRIEATRRELQEQAHQLGYRNEPKLKRDQKVRDEYEAEHGLGSWPGYEPLNLGSITQMGQFLFKTLKLRPLMFTKKTGRPSTSADHMAMLKHPFCTAVALHNQWTHVFNTYYVGAAEHIKSDGKFHAYPWLHGTTTGRRAYTEPAMQTFPQPYTVGPELSKIREVIVPSELGSVLIEADYQQIEVWIGALLSGDANMLADLQEPYASTTGSFEPDYHSRVARSILKCEAPDGSPEFKIARQLAKTTTFSLMYLVEVDHFATIIQQSKKEAARIHREWYRRYQDFGRWQQRILVEMRKVGEITTPFGYRRRFPIVLDHTMDKVAVNHPIQSTGGTLSLLSLVELHRTLAEWDARVLLDVHDSLLFECPREHVQNVCSEIRRVMCDPKIPGWPQLKIDIKIGPNWGAMQTESTWLAEREDAGSLYQLQH